MVGLIIEEVTVHVTNRVLNMTHYIYNATFYCMIWCIHYCSSNNIDYLVTCNDCARLYNCKNLTRI